MGDIFKIGTSGMLSFQRALTTIGNNIANSNTEGYSRQQTTLVSNSPSQLGGNFFGTGVSVGETRRVVDEFFLDTLRLNTATESRYSTLLDQASQIDTLLADPKTGMGEALENFFAAVDGVSNDPASIPARQVLLTQAEILVDRFGRLDSQISRISQNIDDKLDQIASEVNALANGIAELNANITRSSSGANGGSPNDLLDQRDKLLEDLSRIVSVNAVNTGDGAVNVLIGSGETLVVGTVANPISTRISTSDSTKKELVLTIGGNQFPVNLLTAGGEVQGLADFRQNILEPARDGLGLMAVGLAETFNAQHRLGMDLNGLLGTNFFNDMTIGSASAAAANVGSGAISTVISDVTQLKASQYRVDFDGNFTVTRLSDNTVIGSYPPGTTTLTSEGFSFSTSGAAVLGDTFLISPVRTKATDIQVNLSDTKLIAAASPVKSVTDGNNLGTGVISVGTVSQVTGAEFTTTPGALTPPLLIVFTNATTYEIHNNTTPPITLPSPGTLLATDTITPNTVNQLIPAGLNYGYQFELSGAPETGDRFEVVYNIGGISDNRNMLALSTLQSTKQLNSATATYREAYGQIVADVGNRTREAKISAEANTSLLRQSQARRDSISGVNLDEEAARLLQFQNAFQAAAQIINAATTIFDELIRVTR